MSFKREDGSGKPVRRTCCAEGDCKNCLEDKRWDRLFKEKFEDPYYYRQAATRSVSPVTGF